MEDVITKRDNGVVNSQINIIKLNQILDRFKGEDSVDGYLKIEGSNIRVTHINCTPELAEYLLVNYNKHNRPLSKVNLKYLTREFDSGKWMINGDTIKINANGWINDGQHRLTLIAKSGFSVPLIIMSGLDPTSFKSLDVNRKRTGSDVLAINGIKSSTNASAVVKFLKGYFDGRYSQNVMATRTLSNTEIEEYYHSLPNLDESIKFLNKYSVDCKGFIRPTLIGGFHYLMGEIDTDMRDEFLIKLCSGIGLDKDSPITALRSKLIRFQFDKNSRLTNTDVLKNITYTWNQFREGKKLKVIKIPADYEIGLI